ncbi:MAG TPA: hypothetical protein VHR42_02095, partial [Clostridia bacterium]|nr:hypothetical protein [Clostridia bacterium]
MKKINRALIYILGLFSLALGIVLNTKAKLGVSPIISIPYGISIIWNINPIMIVMITLDASST